MRSITSVSTITLISILMVGCLGTSPCCLRTCVCTHVLYRLFVPGRLLEILLRFSLCCQSFMAVCIAIWESVLSGFLYRTPLLHIFSVLHVSQYI